MDIQTLSAAIALCSKKSGASDLGIAALQKEIAAIKNGTTALPYLSSKGGELEGNINLNGNAIENISSLSGTKIILNSQVGGEISADGKVISDIGIPVSDNDAATKKFVEDSISGINNFLKLDGTSTMVGDLDLGNNNIKNLNSIKSNELTISIGDSSLMVTEDEDNNLVQLKGVAEPTEDNDVVTKKFGDSQYAPFSSLIQPTVNGNPINIVDSMEAPIQELSIYGKTEQATTTGAQLLPAELGQTVTSKDDTVSASVQLDGIYIIANASATTSNNSDIYFAGNPTASDESGYDSIPLSEGTYTVQNTGNFFILFIVVWRNSSSVILANISSEQTKTISIKDGDKFRIFFRSLKNGAATEKVQATITAGSAALPWEPYTGGKPSPSPEYPQELDSVQDVSITISDGGDGSQTLSFNGSLPGIPVNSGGNYTDPDGQQWVCNYRDWGRGVDVQMLKEFVFNGTEQWITELNQNGVRDFRIIVSPEVKEGYFSMSNYYNYIRGNDTTKSFWIAPASGNIYCIFKDDRFPGVSEWEEWLSTKATEGNPLKMIAYLAIPIETPIPAEELSAYKAMQTYDGTTNVTATDGAGLSMRYVSDTKKYIDNKIAELQQQLAETQNALLEG